MNSIPAFIVFSRTKLAPTSRDWEIVHGPSVIVCVNLYTIEQADVRRQIGLLSPELQTKIDNCLKVAFGLT
jgi:mRNA-degrading endonuclease toxin of MazEF toxin-antitoxin module